MGNLDTNFIVQSIIMIITLLFFILIAYILWLGIRALRKYLRDNNK